MLRTNSQGSVVSAEGGQAKDEQEQDASETIAVPAHLLTMSPPSLDNSGASILPPEFFPRRPGVKVEDIDMDKTASPSPKTLLGPFDHEAKVADEDEGHSSTDPNPTPRASSSPTVS